MKNLVAQTLVALVLVSMACKDANHEYVETSSKPASFISSDTAIVNESSAEGRYYSTKTYWITSTTPANEGETLTITMNTTNVSTGTSLAYTISGVDTADISPAKLTGTFVIGTGGKVSIPIALKADKKTEGTETLKVTSMNVSLSVAVADKSTGTTTTTAPVTGTTFTTDTIPFSDYDFVAPGRGANTFHSFTQSVKLPDPNTVTWSMDNDARFLWSQLQPTSAGVFNWTDFDIHINASIDKGQKFSFGIMTVCTGCGQPSVGGAALGYPAFLHNAMQSETNKDWNYAGTWVPNWNSENYLKAYEDLLTAIANHINSGSYKGISYKNVVAKVDVRGFGNWGEWHTVPWRDSGLTPAATKPTDATHKRIIDAHIKAFPNYPLILIAGTFTGEVSVANSYYALTTSNAWGPLGWRKDHIGDIGSYPRSEAEENTRTYNGVALSTLIMNKWKTSPIVGEPMTNLSSVTGTGSCSFWEMESQVRRYHMSQFSNTNAVSAGVLCADNNYRAASKASGYRLAIKGGSISGTSLTLNWSNIGIAPVYENWDVYLELRSGTSVVWSGKSLFKPKLFLPGTTSVKDVLGTVAAGTYSLYVIIKDPLGYRKPFVLANKNRQADGSYKVADIKL